MVMLLYITVEHYSEYLMLSENDILLLSLLNSCTTYNYILRLWVSFHWSVTKYYSLCLERLAKGDLGMEECRLAIIVTLLHMSILTKCSCIAKCGWLNCHFPERYCYAFCLWVRNCPLTKWHLALNTHYTFIFLSNLVTFKMLW